MSRHTWLRALRRPVLALRIRSTRRRLAKAQVEFDACMSAIRLLSHDIHDGGYAPGWMKGPALDTWERYKAAKDALTEANTCLGTLDAAIAAAEGRTNS